MKGAAMARRSPQSDTPSEDEAALAAATRAELEAMRTRIAELESDSQRLAAEPVNSEHSGESGPEASTPRPRQRWRAPLSAVCIVIAAILVPVSIVASWARAELVDQDAFVQTFAPLADDPDVQALIIDETVAAIDESINIDGLVDDLFDGIASLGIPRRAAAALDLLRGPAAAGVHSTLSSSITAAVESDAFSSVWDRALRLSHTAMLAAVTNDGSGAVAISDTGEIGIQLGPIVADLRQRLLDQGFRFASVIPTVDRTIVVAQSDAIVVVRTVYTIAVLVGWWIPLLCLGLFVLGIALARRRATGLIGSGIGIAIGGAAVAIALAVAGTTLALNADNRGISSAAITAIFAQVTSAMRDTAIMLIALGVFLALVAWLAGGSRVGGRTALGAINSGARAGMAARGVDTGAVGRWLYRQRVLVRGIIFVASGLWLLALRPLSIGDVVLVFVVGVVVWWLAEVAQQRPDELTGGGADARGTERIDT